MEGTLHYGKQLYIKCCLRRKAKPNEDIIAQVDRPDVVLAEVIDASQTFVDRDGVLAILDFASQQRCLRKLVLSQNNVDTTCVKHLCDILKGGHSSLCSIDLSYSNLSVPAMRALWETARTVHSLVEVCLDNSDVPEEWAKRLFYQLSKNRELQERRVAARYLGHNSIDWGSNWHTTFVLLLSTNHSQMERYSRHVLQILSHPAAALRRRLASIMIGADETKENIQQKVQYCCEAHTQKRVWCVVLLDGTPFTNAQRLALDMVLVIQSSSTTADQRELCDVAESLFVYYPIEDRLGDDAEPVTSLALPPSTWLALAGCDEKQRTEWASRTQRDAYVLTPEIYKIRCQSDLLSSLRSVYLNSGDEDQITHTGVSGSDDDVSRHIDPAPHPVLELVTPDSASAKHLSKNLLHYIESTPDDAGTPLLVYGFAGVGKRELLRHVAQNLRIDSDNYSVRFIEIDSPNTGVVVFLYRMLQLLDPKAAQRHYYNTKALQEAVKEAAAAYSGRERVVIIVSRVDQLEPCGMDNSVRVDWVPVLLPPKLRIVLSLNTESDLLRLLRTRLPQPSECLIHPEGSTEGVDAYCRMLTQRGLSLPGVREGQTKDHFSAAKKSYAQKHDSVRMFYGRLAAAYTEHLLKTNAVESEEEVALLIQEQLPGSLAELVQAACQQVAAAYGEVAVSWVLLGLTNCPLAAIDIEEVCERLGRCPPHSSVPALLHLVELGLVEFDSGAKARLSHHAICADVVSRLYAHEVDCVSVAVETHLRLITAQYMGIYSNFPHLISLMLANGNFNAVVELLSNADLVDRMLSHKEEGFPRTMEAFFRLISACDLVDKLAAAGEPLKDVTLDREKIECSLRDVQLSRGPGFFQYCLLSCSESPLHYSALHQLDREGGSVPYSVLVPLKIYAEEGGLAAPTSNSRLSVNHLHCRGDYLVASTPNDVTVYHTHTLEKLAHMPSPFNESTSDLILGSFVGIGPRVVVLAATQVFLWNFGADASLRLENTSAMVAPCSLDIFGDALIVAQPANSNRFAIVSVSQRQTLRELPPAALAGRPRRALFGGPAPLLIEGRGVRVCVGPQAVLLLHDGPVGAVDGSPDGRFVAAAVGGGVWLWQSTGRPLHRIHAAWHPVTRLAFSPTGQALLVERTDDATVWQTATGAPLARLLNPLAETDAAVAPGVGFGHGGSLLIGRVGPHGVVWHAESGAPLGVLPAADGAQARLCVDEDRVFAILRRDGAVQRVDLLTTPLLPTQAAASGTVDPDHLWGGRVSGDAIQTVSMSPTLGSQLVACVDRSGRLYVFSMQTGARLDRVVEPPQQDAPVHAAVVAGPRLVAYVSYAHSCVSFLSLPKDTAYTTPATVTSCPLPRELLWGPVVDARLYASHSKPSYVGLMYTYRSRSRMILYKTDPPSRCFQLIGEERMIFASFRGQFAYTVDEGRWIKLWNLAKGVERTSYQHPHPIVAAAESKESTDSILCLDATKTMYLVNVLEISSLTQASFVLTKIERPNLRRHCSLFSVRDMACVKESIVLLSAGSNKRSMRLGITSANRDDALHETPIRGISCISIGVRNEEEVLVVGYTDGRLLFYRVVEPTV